MPGNLQREAKFSKTRNSEKKTIVFAADRCSVAKIQVAVSLRKSIVFVADVCSENTNLRVCKRNGRRRTSKSWKTVKNREATEHTSAGKSKFTSQIQVPDSLRKSIVFAADRCSSAKFRSKRAQT